MKLMWMSNAPWAATGYGNQTKLFVPRLQEAGHEMGIFAFYGLEGSKLSWGDVPVYPKGFQVWGNDIGAAHTRHHGGEVLISLVDAWVMEPQMLQLHNVKWIPWFPVDMEPLPRIIRDKVAQAYRRIVFSHFAERMVNDAGLDCYYVPHGVDTDVFKPLPNRQAAKEQFGWGDRFVVGTVAANKGVPSRKSYPEMIKAFALFKSRHPDAVLYIHGTKSEQGQNQGMNLPELCAAHGLIENRDVWFADQYRLVMGMPDEYMNAIYNAMDVFLLPSMGEGFGIPIVEAQAAGTPVIVGAWTAMDELCFSGWKIPKGGAHPYWTPLAAHQYIPQVGAITRCLEDAYEQVNDGWREKARKGATYYDADRVTKKFWLPVLKDIEQLVYGPDTETRLVKFA